MSTRRDGACTGLSCQTPMKRCYPFILSRSAHVTRDRSYLMRPLSILGLATATLIAISCGARTPFDDVELGRSTGSGGGGDVTGGPGTGPSATTSGTGDTTTTTGGDTSGSSGVGGSGAVTSTGSGPGTSGSTTTGSAGGGPGTSGSTTTGSGPGTSGSTTTGAAGTSGQGGAGGRSGTGGAGGGGGGPAGGNPLLGILPGIRSTPACNRCVDTRCNGTSACSSDPACLSGVACYFAACASLPNEGERFACALKCFNGNVQLFGIAIQAVSCVYGSCGPMCGGR